MSVEESAGPYIDNELKFPTDSYNSHLGSWGRPTTSLDANQDGTIRAMVLGPDVGGTYLTACLISVSLEHLCWERKRFESWTVVISEI